MEIVRNRFTGEPDLDRAVKALGYPSRAHAVVDLSVFPPPSIVQQVGGVAVVNAVRNKNFGTIRAKHTFLPPREAEAAFGFMTSDGAAKGVFLDDNGSPDWALRACFDVKRDQGSTHVCHIFKMATYDPRYFTSLPNLALVPSWLHKLTDTDASVASVLRWIARTVYGFCPGNTVDARHVCPACRVPQDAPAEDWIRERIARYEAKRVRDYLANARRISKNQRWLNAIEAGRGYGHVLLKP